MRNNSFAIYTATGRILAMLCNFAIPVLLTRILTQDDYGIYSQFILLLGFTGSLFSFGLQSNLYYFYQSADEQRKKTLLGNTLFSMMAFAVIAFVFMEIPFLSRLFVKDSALGQYMGIVGICVMLNIPTYILFPLFVIRSDKSLSVMFPSIEVFLKVLFTIGGVLIFGSVRAIFIGLLSVHILLFIFAIIYSFMPLRKVNSRWIDWNLMKEQLKYAIPFGLSIVLFTIFRQFDKVLCISYITPSEYAVYSLAFYGIPGINQIYDSVSEVNLLNMASAYRDGDKSLTLKLYKSFCTKLLSFSIPLIFVVFLFANEIFGLLFAPDYMSAVPFFRIYIFSFIIGGLGAGTILRATGKTRYTLRAFLYTLFLYLPFSFFSIKHYGVLGAITTAMLGIILPRLFQISFEKKLLNVPFRDYMPWGSFAKIFIVSSIILLPVAGLYYILDFGVWVACAAAFVYLLAVYFIEMKMDIFLIDKDVIIRYYNAIKTMMNKR